MDQIVIHPYDKLSEAITTAKLSFEETKQLQLLELNEEKANLLASFREASDSEIQEKIIQAVELDKLINTIAGQKAEDLVPRKVLLFNNQIYNLSPETVKRVKGAGKFQAGQRVRLEHDGKTSEIYVVGEDGNAYLDNKPYKASILTKKFIVETLGKPDNGWDVAGFSHAYWKAVE